MTLQVWRIRKKSFLHCRVSAFLINRILIQSDMQKCFIATHFTSAFKLLSSFNPISNTWLGIFFLPEMF